MMMKNNNLPNVNFERNMNHNYMILKSCDFFGNATEDNSDFRKKMLLENDIPGLLPVSQRIVNGDRCYYYEINSLHSLDRLYNKKEIGNEELRQILMCCVKLFESLEEYLLDGSQIILKPEYIYMNLDSHKLFFTCYPEYEGDVREEFKDFIDLILTKIDHTDNEAVMLGYKVYRYTKNPNYVIGEIARLIETAMPQSPQTISQQPIAESNYYFEEEPVVKNDENDNKDNKVKKAKLGKAKKEKIEKVKKEKVKKEKANESKGKIVSLIIALISILLIYSGMASSIEIYLYGVLAMSLVGTVLFAISDAKKKKHAKEKEELGIYEVIESNVTESNIIEQSHPNNVIMPKPTPTRHPKIEEHQKTTCLNNNSLEERLLIGRVNGKEVTIPLTQFPATLGKQEGFSDIIVDDKAVSKMHARFDEMEGRIYISDLNSTNGTIRNGEMIDINSPVVLEVGDRLRFGRSCFTYC